VREVLSREHVSLDIERLEKAEKSLLIVDSLKKYTGNISPDSDYNYNQNLVNYAKSKGKSGVSIIADKGTFPFKQHIDELVSFELSLPSKYDIDIKRICVYHQKDFNKVPEDQKEKLLDHHTIAVKI
jgi:hypothetical protein